ncbi:hypothetical protein [Aestuariispira insulae]|uniref:Uncharacterized protein n=1 Tax=Aestuariispira insulae TaxID=1461337 RepID=A0A3D9HRT6_9PROT|nr:hypothetical protein [Aestuariispira insulae]RED52169.1 hypothetical protein DFP90_102187 [Aestuariispira insulae]
MKKSVVIAGGMALGVAVLLGVHFGGQQLFSACERIERGAFPSPNGQFEARLIEVDCGGTTPLGTHVTVSDRTAQETMTVLIAKDRQDLRLEWDSNETLDIGLPALPDEALVRQLGSWNGITVRYQPAE